MKVECTRDGTIWEAEIKQYSSKAFSFSRKESEAAGYVYPARSIDCPTCYGRYFLMADGTWVWMRHTLKILKAD